LEGRGGGGVGRKGGLDVYVYVDVVKGSMDIPIGSPMPLNKPPLPELPFSSSLSLDSVGMCVVSSLSGILTACIRLLYEVWIEYFVKAWVMQRLADALKLK
jgi:hypothetical protein